MFSGQPHDLLFVLSKLPPAMGGAGGQDKRDVLQPQRPRSCSGISRLAAQGWELPVPVVLDVEDIPPVTGKNRPRPALLFPADKATVGGAGQAVFEAAEGGKAIPKGRFPIRR